MKNSVFFTEEIQLQMKGLSFSTIMLDIQENTIFVNPYNTSIALEKIPDKLEHPSNDV